MPRTTYGRRRDVFPRIRYGARLPGGLTLVHIAIPFTDAELASLRAQAEREGARVADIAATAIVNALHLADTPNDGAAP